MATQSESTTDMGVGLTLALSVIAVIGAALMLVGAPDTEAAWGFAAAVIFSLLAVVAVHLYWE